MTKIKAIIVDDEPKGISVLKKTLEMMSSNVEIMATSEDVFDALSKIKQVQPNLVFLDVNIGTLTAFDLLKQFDTINFEIIFVSAHIEYMHHAFSFSAVDYLIKPVNELLLLQAVTRAEVRINDKTKKDHISTLLHNVENANNPTELKLCISSVKGFQVVDISSLLYCQAEGSYTIFILMISNQLHHPNHWQR